MKQRGSRGVEVPSLGPETDAAEQKYLRRLKIVREADVDNGRAQAFHDLLWRRMARTEQARDFANVLSQKPTTQ